jgi:long-chain acyl-CoA synthetase
MLHEKRPWLSVYRTKLSSDPIRGSLTTFLEEAVERYGDNIALTQGERRISYAELLDRTKTLAAALSEAGVRQGDRVSLMLPNCPEYVISFFGAMRIGATATQVNPLYFGHELKHIFNDSSSDTVIVHAMMYDRVKDVQSHTSLKRVICVGEPEGGLADRDKTFDEFMGAASASVPEVEVDHQNDLASIQYTGGTTGVSKGAMLTHSNLLGGVQ